MLVYLDKVRFRCPFFVLNECLNPATLGQSNLTRKTA